MLFRYKGRLVTSQQNVMYILSCLNLKCCLIEMRTNFAPDYRNKIILQKTSNSQEIHPKTCPSHREPPIWEVGKCKSFVRIGQNFKAKCHKTTKNSMLKLTYTKALWKYLSFLASTACHFWAFKSNASKT